MKQDLQLRLQAYLDGELPSGEAQAVVDWLAQDAAARDLLVELTNTHAALLTHESDIKVSDSREFYWSKIRRQIEREEQSAPLKTSVSLMERFRRLLVPAGAVAAVLIGVVLVQQKFSSSDADDSVAFVTDASNEDSETFTYRDYGSGTTLVWLSYPAENEFAETDIEDTLEFN